MTPVDDLAGARAATADLLTELDGLAGDVAALRAPSLLRGWTRAHVVAHLTGNALSHVRMLDGCLAGQVRRQYPGGAAQRREDIEALAARPAEVVAVHREACAALEQRWAAMGPGQWQRAVHWLDGEPQPAFGEAWSRWKEVEVHRTDLATGHAPSHWADRVLVRVLDDRGGRLAGPGVVLAPDGWGGEVLPVGSPPGTTVAGDLDELVLWVLGRSRGTGLRTGSGMLPELPEWR